MSFLNLTLSGIFFASYAIVNENIWGVCGLHFAWNFALGNIYGFSVSGFYIIFVYACGDGPSAI